jgi:hypothetical protein
MTHNLFPPLNEIPYMRSISETAIFLLFWQQVQNAGRVCPAHPYSRKLLYIGGTKVPDQLAQIPRRKAA